MTTTNTTKPLPLHAFHDDSVRGALHLATLNEDDAAIMAEGNTLDKTGNPVLAEHAAQIARDAIALARYALAILWEVVEGPAGILDADAEAVHEHAGALACSIDDYTVTAHRTEGSEPDTLEPCEHGHHDCATEPAGQCTNERAALEHDDKRAALDTVRDIVDILRSNDPTNGMATLDDFADTLADTLDRAVDTLDQ
jgi:hypothetical protein